MLRVSGLMDCYFISSDVFNIVLNLSVFVYCLAGGCLQFWLIAVRNVYKRTFGSAAD